MVSHLASGRHLGHFRSKMAACSIWGVKLSFLPVMVIDSAMRTIRVLSRFFARFKHPYSLPEEVAAALGVRLSNLWSREQLVRILESSNFRPVRLTRMMGRDEAEAAFHLALFKEKFKFCSLFSFQFSDGYVEFSLQFDRENRLRRCYLYYTDSVSDAGHELKLVS